MDSANQDEALRFKRRPPEVQFFTIEGVLLDGVYDLVEHMLAFRQTTSREDITRLCNSVDYDVERLRGYLRDVKAETKALRGGEPLSKQTDLEPHQEQ